MTKIILFAAVGLLFAFATTASLADPPVQPTKWSQLPDMNFGLDFSSEPKVPSIVADDWRCPDGLPVTDIHWWGSYWVPRLPVPTDGSPNSDSLPDAAPGGIQSFILRIWDDVAVGPDNPYSHPGNLLLTFDTATYNEVFYGTTAAGKNVYQYNVYLPETMWFPQVAGQIYWLSIEAVLTDPMRQWGWHESNQYNLDGAVQDFKGSYWVTLENNLYKNNMAFELTTVPEPGSLVSLAMGAFGLVGFAVKRRKRS